MLGFEGQWVATINEDDIDPDEFRLLSVKESADLSLPIAHLQFYTQDMEKFRRYSDPGYKVKIGLGIDEPKTFLNFVTISEKAATYLGNDQWILDLWLIADFLDYFSVQRTVTYETASLKKKSSEVFATIMNRLGLTPETTPSNDQMMWIQHNISDRKFLEEVCYHGWFADKNPAIAGIRRNKKAIYKPISLLLSPKAKMGNIDDLRESEGDLILNEFEIGSRDGLLSMWVGRERKVPVHNHELGTDEVISSILEKKIADEPGLFDTTRYTPISWANDNIHSKWYESEAQNLQYKASLSATSFKVSLSGQFRDVYVLDCYRNIWESSTGEVLKEISGLWLVTDIKHKIVANSYSVEIVFSREKLLKKD